MPPPRGEVYTPFLCAAPCKLKSKLPVHSRPRSASCGSTSRFRNFLYAWKHTDFRVGGWVPPSQNEKPTGHSHNKLQKHKIVGMTVQQADPKTDLNFSFTGNYNLHSLPLCSSMQTQVEVGSPLGALMRRNGYSYRRQAKRNFIPRNRKPIKTDIHSCTPPKKSGPPERGTILAFGGMFAGRATFVLSILSLAPSSSSHRGKQTHRAHRA